jgi:hypothetical protein
MAWVFGTGTASAAGAGGAGAGVVGGEAQENIPGRMIIRRSTALNGRMFVFTVIIVYNRLENNKSEYGVSEYGVAI